MPDKKIKSQVRFKNKNQYNAFVKIAKQQKRSMNGMLLFLIDNCILSEKAKATQ